MNREKYRDNDKEQDGGSKNMKVLLLNGSIHRNGTTHAALEEVAQTLQQEGIETEIFQIGAERFVTAWIAGNVTKQGCIFTDDAVNESTAKAKEADGFIFGTPVYYAHPSGRIQSFLDRAFFSQGAVFRYKPGAAVAVARRGGTTASLDVLNKYFGISQMPTVGSLEYGAWHGWGRSASGYRRDADHAEPGAQHGMALKVHRSREAAGHSTSGHRSAETG